MSKQRDALTRRFRKVAWGRLYWKRSNPNMRRFDSDDVCIVKNGTLSTHYKSIDAFVKQIEEAEMDNTIPKYIVHDREWFDGLIKLAPAYVADGTHTTPAPSADAVRGSEEAG